MDVRYRSFDEVKICRFKNYTDVIFEPFLLSPQRFLIYDFMIRIFWCVMVAVLANVLKVYEGQVFPSVALRCALPLLTGATPVTPPVLIW